ncbi:hypothetical protein [Desulfosarcina sp.]|uniref:hypothetical protein n=1 Tax=Desulfosarcina sp. TaxID=2027861 RepID=UPI0035656213
MPDIENRDLSAASACVNARIVVRSGCIGVSEKKRVRPGDAQRLFCFSGHL